MTRHHTPQLMALPCPVRLFLHANRRDNILRGRKRKYEKAGREPIFEGLGVVKKREEKIVASIVVNEGFKSKSEFFVKSEQKSLMGRGCYI
jgi:hypothetical protein